MLDRGLDGQKNATIKSSSFASFIYDQKLNDERIKHFSYSLQFEDIHIKIGQSALFTPKFSISITAKDSAQVEQIFHQLKQWTIDHTGPGWQQTWRKIAGWHLLFVLLMFGAIAAFSSFIPISDNRSHDLYTAQAHDLLKNGISQAEVPKALETLLALQIHYEHPSVPSESNRAIDRGILVAFCTIMALAWGGCFPPPSLLIGTGKGKRRLAAWRFYLGKIGYIAGLILAAAIAIIKAPIIAKVVDFLHGK